MPGGGRRPFYVIQQPCSGGFRHVSLSTARSTAVGLGDGRLFPGGARKRHQPASGPGGPAGYRRRPARYLPRRGARPLRAGAGVPHRRQDQPPHGDRGRPGGSRPAAGGAERRGRAAGAGRGPRPAGLRPLGPAAGAQRAGALPHPARAAGDQPVPVRFRGEPRRGQRRPAGAGPRAAQGGQQPGRLRGAGSAGNRRHRATSGGGRSGGGRRPGGVRAGGGRRPGSGHRSAGAGCEAVPGGRRGGHRTVVAPRRTLPGTHPRAGAGGGPELANLRGPRRLRQRHRGRRAGPERAGAGGPRQRRRRCAHGAAGGGHRRPGREFRVGGEPG